MTSFVAATAATYTLTVPEGSSVWVGNKHYDSSWYMYQPFAEVEAASTSTAGGKTTYTYNVSGTNIYRVKQDGKLTHAGKFTGNVEVTADELNSQSNKYVNRDVTSNGGYNSADIFININEKGHLKLATGETHQLVTLRNWTLLETTITSGSTTFIEPDYNYTVINENGEADNSVVSINDKGLLTAVNSGTAIILVTYDALNASYLNATFGTLWSALWAENTGVFVVSVDAPASGVISGMTINENLNTNAAHKLATTAVDAELDVFYYLEETGGFDYTFTPNGTTSVSLAQPTIDKDENELSFNGFGTDGVTNNGDGSYTVKLIEGRNIVKLSSELGAEYQVLTAKAVTYDISNLTNPDAERFSPGDKVSIKFNTLYHPCNKLAGIYNMSAGIQYNGTAMTFSPFGGPNQYTFASKAQEYNALKIPSEFAGNKFVFTNGVIKADGFGNPYGDHRNVKYDIKMNTNAAQRTAYFGALPDIVISLKEEETITSINDTEADNISVYPNPFADYIIVNTTDAGTASIYSLSGKTMLNANIQNGTNRIQTSELAKGIYILKIGENAIKIVK